MPEIEEKLIVFEKCFKRFMKTDEIIFMLLTTHEDNRVNEEYLALMEIKVNELNDEILFNLFKKVQEEVRVLGLYQPFQTGSYYGFLQRLGAILNEATVQAENADIALREVIGLGLPNSSLNTRNKNDSQPTPRPN